MFSRTRKKKNIVNNKKFIILCFILLISLIVLYFLINFAYTKLKIKSNFENDIISNVEKESSDIFKIDKIILYSSANAINNETTRDLWNLNIYQYTDIAIYLNNNIENGLTTQNTIKNLYIDNINFSTLPERGTPTLYYKDINNFGTSELLEDNKINEALNFNIINSDEILDTSKANFYTTSQTPITLEFVNEEIKTNAIIPNNNTALKFDGSLLSNANISLNSIACTVSFNINIVNNLDEKFVYKTSFSIPLEDVENSIYNGYIKKELNNFSNSAFLKIK